MPLLREVRTRKNQPLSETISLAPPFRKVSFEVKDIFASTENNALLHLKYLQPDTLGL